MYNVICMYCSFSDIVFKCSIFFTKVVIVAKEYLPSFFVKFASTYKLNSFFFLLLHYLQI